VFSAEEETRTSPEAEEWRELVLVGHTVPQVIVFCVWETEEVARLVERAGTADGLDKLYFTHTSQHASYLSPLSFYFISSSPVLGFENLQC
jgi:hypothetical protein